MDDARLCLAVVRSAVQQGACVANHVEAVGFEFRGGLVSRVRAVDRVGGAELAVRARLVLNAAGAWGDAVRRLAGDETGPRLRPTKGVHLVAPGRGLTAAFLLLHPADGRVFFVLPWMGKTLLGTTDTDCDEPPDRLTVAPAEVAYLLEGHNHYFGPGLSASEVLSFFVGLRPLIAPRRGEPSARSREFALTWSASGLLSASGGKYTTYRAMAEAATDAAAQRLGLRRRCRTRDFRLDGAPRRPWTEFAPAAAAGLCRRYGLDSETARHLVGRYGERAVEAAAYVESDAALRRPVAQGEPDLRAELAYQRDHEMAVFPADFLLRRTRLGLFRPALL
jgi:glycerol-3-phosphate dehydrogenase